MADKTNKAEKGYICKACGNPIGKDEAHHRAGERGWVHAKCRGKNAGKKSKKNAGTTTPSAPAATPVPAVAIETPETE